MSDDHDLQGGGPFELKLKNAVNGFDPLSRKRGVTGNDDDGTKSPIFEYKIFDNKTQKYSQAEYITHHSKSSCKVETTTKAARTFQSFFESMADSYKFDENEKKDTEINILFVHRNYGSRMHTHKEGEMQQMKKAFQEHQSEVYITVATCITDIFDEVR